MVSACRFPRSDNKEFWSTVLCLQLKLSFRTRYFSEVRKGHAPLHGRAYYQMMECLGVSSFLALMLANRTVCNHDAMLFCLLPMTMWCIDVKRKSCAAGENPFTDARRSWQDSEVASYQGYHRGC
jgi:hypothetical protein